MMLSKEDQSSLLNLTWHWDSAYAFSVVDGEWQAVPATEPSAVLTAETAEELREKVREDYACRQARLKPIGGERMST
jgi:nitroimidazol reductase NimA-like FMN-containing flavoprotein (pyridoxamine 5'-phosphate oxidase superfamily)